VVLHINGGREGWIREKEDNEKKSAEDGSKNDNR
jgi:hypothetical protein